MSAARTHFDVIIVGSGAGGATIANELAASGKSILILERGEHLPRARQNWDAKSVFVERKYRTDEKWYDKDGKPFHPNTHYWVGGNTTFYGGALFRMRPGDFQAQAHHGGGVSPAWPIQYEDLAPYYLKAEKLWKVHGQRGADPTEPKGLPDYFYPALTHDPTIANLEAHFRKLGWRPFPIPLGVDRDEQDPVQSNCIRCLTCGGYPCLVRAKSDARTIALDPILRQSNITLLTGRRVFKLETDPQGKSVRRVMAALRDGSWEDYTADIVVLAAGAVNTAAILLASDNPGHRNGLANRSDQVGRNYMFHTLSAVVSVTLDKAEADFPKTLAVNDFYWRDPDGGFDYPMGHIQLLEHMEGHVLEGQIKEEGVAGDLLPDFIADAAADRMLAFLCISEDLPDPNNRVRLDGERLRLEYTGGDIEGHKRLVKKLDWAMDRFDDGGRAIIRHHFQFTKLLPLYGVAHMCGTTRFGADPRASVLDRDCKAWELDNLYVADASFFASSSAINPTLTIVANAMRVADHLKLRLGVRDPSDQEIAREVEAAMALMAIEPEITSAQAAEAAKKRRGFSIWPFGR
jgi:choline dehydrogenase-like flavoprotein